MIPRRLSITLSVLLGLVVSACGGGGGSAGESVGPAPSPGQVTGSIRYVLWDSNQLPAYQACQQAFTQKYPAAQVNIEQQGWGDYWNGMTTGFVAGTAPDVFTDHVAKYPEFAKHKLLLALNDFMARDGVTTNAYFPGLPDLWASDDGRRFGLPKDWDTIAFAYNKALIDEAGIAQSDLAKLTWNPQDGGTFEKMVAHLSVDANGKRGDETGFDKNNVKTYGLGLENSGAPYGQTQWSFFAAANGWQYLNKNPWGNHYNYDDPKFVDTITWWRSLIDKGFMPRLETTLGVSYVDQFTSGKYATVSVGDWQIGDVRKAKFDTSFFPTPIGPSGKRASMFNGLADSIFAGSKNKELAWQWVKFLASADCQDLVAQQAVVFPAIPAATDIVKSKRAEEGIDVTAFTIHVDQSSTFLAPIADHASEVTSIMTPALDLIMSFKADPQAKLSEANTKINSLFQ